MKRRLSAPVWCGTNSWSAGYAAHNQRAQAIPKFTEKLKDLHPLPSNFYKDMKAKILTLSAVVALSLTTPAFAKTRVVQTRNGRALVTNTSNHRNHWRGDRFRSGSSVFWNVGIGVPFYGGYYGGYPYYGGYSYGGYPYYRRSYYGGYPSRLYRYGYPYG